MAFTGNEGDWITLADGSTMTEDHRTTYPSEPMGIFLGKEKLQDLLNQHNAKGIRFYFAQKGGKMNIVAVAADKMENDMTAKVLNGGEEAPPYSSVSNPLNS